MDSFERRNQTEIKTTVVDRNCKLLTPRVDNDCVIPTSGNLPKELQRTFQE